MKTMKVKLTFTEEVLGTASADPEIHREFIASKAPDAPTIEDEVAAVGVDEVAEKSTTIFPRDENGNPFVYDYQIKGFFKDACGVLRRVSDSKSAKLKAYKKEIDGLVFVVERATPFLMDGEPITELGTCQRPLRAETAQGARVALASSETVPAGATIEFTVQVLKDDLLNLVREWLDYGALRGLGQWRNSGKGRFTWCECE